MWNELGTAVQAYEYVTVFDAIELRSNRCVVDEIATGVLGEDKSREEVDGK